MKKDFIAFQGKEFTIEWYFTKKNRSNALEYYAEFVGRSTNQSNEFI